MIYAVIIALIILGFIANKEGKLTGYLSVVVTGILVYLKFKSNGSDEVLKENDDTNKKIGYIDQTIADNKTIIAVEEQKQKDLQKDLSNAKESDTSLNAVVDFLNKR